MLTKEVFLFEELPASKEMDEENLRFFSLKTLK